MPEKNHLSHETLLIVATIVVLKLKFYDFKIANTEQSSLDEKTIRVIYRYL